jgi:hypothetical protein
MRESTNPIEGQIRDFNARLNQISASSGIGVPGLTRFINIAEELQKELNQPTGDIGRSALVQKLQNMEYDLGYLQGCVVSEQLSEITEALSKGIETFKTSNNLQNLPAPEALPAEKPIPFFANLVDAFLNGPGNWFRRTKRVIYSAREPDGTLVRKALEPIHKTEEPVKHTGYLYRPDLAKFLFCSSRLVGKTDAFTKDIGNGRIEVLTPHDAFIFANGRKLKEKPTPAVDFHTLDFRRLNASQQVFSWRDAFKLREKPRPPSQKPAPVLVPCKVG